MIFLSDTNQLDPRIVEFQKKLDEHGFVQKRPRVEFFVSMVALYFYPTDGSARKLCLDAQIDDFLDGKIHFSPEEEAEIRKWYDISPFGLVQEIHRIEKKLKDPKLDLDELPGLYSKLDALMKECTEEGLKKRRMDVFGYYYNETDPERKALLYALHHEI